MSSEEKRVLNFGYGVEPDVIMVNGVEYRPIEKEKPKVPWEPEEAEDDCWAITQDFDVTTYVAGYFNIPGNRFPDQKSAQREARRRRIDGRIREYATGGAWFISWHIGGPVVLEAKTEFARGEPRFATQNDAQRCIDAIDAGDLRFWLTGEE